MSISSFIIKDEVGSNTVGHAAFFFTTHKLVIEQMGEFGCIKILDVENDCYDIYHILSMMYKTNFVYEIGDEKDKQDKHGTFYPARYLEDCDFLEANYKEIINTPYGELKVFTDQMNPFGYIKVVKINSEHPNNVPFYITRKQLLQYLGKKYA